MTNKELANRLEMIVNLIEWEYPIDYAADLVEAAKRLKERDETLGTWVDGNICSCCGFEADQTCWEYCGHCGRKMAY